MRTQHNNSRAPSLHGRYSASSLLWAPPIPANPANRVIDSPAASGLQTPDRRTSQVPRPFLRCPLPPLWADPLLLRITSRLVLASSSLADWPPTYCVSRPKPVQPYGSQLRCPAVSRLCRASRPDRPRSPGFVTSTRQAAATRLIGNLPGNLLSDCRKGQA